MDIWQLKIFVAVVDHQSFSKASEAVNLSQPTVSSHIKDLEDYFGCKLLDRLGKSTEPTRTGKLLYDHAQKILNLRRKAKADIFDFIGFTKGRLVIGGSTIPSGFILPRLIGAFSKKYPNVAIRVVAGDTSQIARGIENGEIESGIIGARVDQVAVRQEKFLTDEMKLIVPGGHPWQEGSTIDCGMLLKEKIIAREEGSGTWKSITSSMKQLGFDAGKLKPVVTMGSTTSVIQGILNGVGISILSTIAVEDDLKKGRLKALSIKGLDLNRHFYLTLPAKRSLSPICKKFIEFMKSHRTQ